ncbi:MULTISPECIES: hypothetical protein [Kitasatospora]|uniref:hypothetical protein n=1 Tax=Kitasatospora TaxID=2063 RepID=UPI0011D21F2D|nr:MULTISPECIES: hypothetical protein [Kitasatospora]
MREIERLIARQGRNRPMARSTIQEKFSGRSPANFTQVLSIVEALGEYGRLNNSPLPPEEIDQSVWRDRVVRSPSQADKKENAAADQTPQEGSRLEFDWEPLRQAEMFDVLSDLEASRSNHLAAWLPGVLREMMNAGMKISSYIEVASQDEPRGIVSLAAALEKEFPPGQPSAWGDDPWGPPEENDLTALELLRLTARRHGSGSSPAIVAGMRRAGIGQYVDYYLNCIGAWHLAGNIEKAVDHLRQAALPSDAKKLLGLVGSGRQFDRLSGVVNHFQLKARIDDRNLILRGIASKGDKYRLRATVADFKKKSMPTDALIEVMRGIPYGRHSDFEQHLREAGLEEMAALVSKATDPPF